MAEIVLGVLPLIGTAFTSYRFLHSQLRAFRHYAKDLDRTAKKFSVQKDRFKLECWLLLRSALDDRTIRQLKGDQSHWDDPEVNAEFERNFKSSYESCLSIIEDISARLKDFEEELEEFLPLIKDREQDESLGQSVRRLRKRVHVTVNRRKYEDICKELKESNNDLKDLSDSIQRLQQPCSRGHQKCLMDGRRNRGDWGSACKARRASAALYEGLQGTFSCGNSPHGHHSMRLFLDVPKRSSLSTMSLAMRMALSVVGRSSHNPAVPTAFHLRVDSRDMKWAIEDPPSPPNSHSQYEDSGRSSKRVKMIEPAQASAVNDSMANTQLQIGGAAFTSEPKETCEQAARDLACILDLCSHFGQHCLCPAQQMPQYIGYLDVQENVRHDFYRSYGRVQTDENVPLSKLLSSFDPRDMNMPQRLKLAKTVATTALTYFDTPWMKDMWRLSDISLLSASTTQDPSVILNTLHLEVDLVSRNRLLTAEDASAMDMALTPQSATNLSDDELLDKGIFNKSLHSLGVALVSIETAQDLDPGNWEDVRNVRKYARGSIFGEKYKAVVEKCFALNCDLRKPNSHRQAFECIVGSLEDMVSSLALDDGEWIS